MKTHLVGLFALSCLSLSLSLAAENKFSVPLTESDTGDYIIKVDKRAHSLIQSLEADKVSTLNTDHSSQTLLVSVSIDRARQLSENDQVHYIEADNYQDFYQTDDEWFTLEDSQEEDFYASNSEIIKNLDRVEHAPYGVALVNADKVPEPSSVNKTVCIIDSGLQADHQDFSGLPISGNHSDYSGFWHIDQVEHGTHVAGTIAAVENGSGVLGVIKNGNVNIYVQKLSNGNRIRTSHTMEAMEVCANQDADVVSMSFGGPQPSMAVNDTIDRLTQRGVLFVAAAGNHGRVKNCSHIPDDQVDRKRACQNAHRAAHFPASYHNVMSVGAVNAKSKKAAFSPQNPQIEMTAPGVNVLSTIANTRTLFDLSLDGVQKPLAHIGNTSTDFPDMPMGGVDCGPTDCLGEAFFDKACLYKFRLPMVPAALNCQASGGTMLVLYLPFPGANSPIRGSFGVPFSFPIFSVGNDTATRLINDPQAKMDFDKYFTRYAFQNGTSMSTPHMSGVAAKVWSHNPSCSNKQIRKVLQFTAKDLGETGRDVKFGHGLVDAKAAHDYIQSQGCDIPTPTCPDSWYWNQAYNKGEQVTHQGQIYKANWWSKDTDPKSANGQWQAWQLVGACNE